MEQQPIDKHGEDRTQEEAAARVTWQHAVRHVPLLLAVSALLLCLFGLLAWFVHLHPVLVLDVTIAHEVQADQDSWLRTSMLAMSYLGSSLLLVGLVVLAAVIFWVRHLRLEAVMVIGVYATNRLVNELIKLLVNRPRPTARLVEVLQQMAGASFPSGNVMNYLAFWGLLCAFGILLWRGKRWWRLLLVLLATAAAVLVGFSRIYLGDHWASDVLGGVSTWRCLARSCPLALPQTEGEGRAGSKTAREDPSLKAVLQRKRRKLLLQYLRSSALEYERNGATRSPETVETRGMGGKAM